MEKELLKKIENKIINNFSDGKWYTTEEIAYFLGYRRWKRYILEALRNLNAKQEAKMIREIATHSWQIKDPLDKIIIIHAQ